MEGLEKLTKDGYPQCLLEIPEPPEQLFYLGEIPNFDEYKYLAVVGSRNHTSYGKEVVRKIIEGLSGYPICIVSGLALGIDTLAHKYALEYGLKTLSIPGSGIDFEAIHPRTNINLAREIISKGGCLMSEMLPDQKAKIFSFPRRNRIMAGITQAVLIIEAEEKSGTLITARLALDYNREVFVVPGSIFSDTSVGTNRLIKQGATPVTSARDILEFFNFIEPVGFENNQDTKQSHNLNPEEQAVYTMLREPIERDELIYRLGTNISEAQSLLTIMEIKGLIEEEYGMIRRRNI
ncbi:DNA protecting protein DprA [Candidatus Nomurabacteria bacterium RIFCSPHIGHO2_02_FULL_38_15]|uniref:DNA protecting protein DprA n=1 Tax=Candidatus Nomurabacteria bacterium RIFCSPHIGHO2_02_FULL_38_15 TaxID=1801752 RepID=A0A1F6VQ77_9BACT|nr:MAG: DNA protecting protein DprA [Candidatus Nomurabacteria bacterium RIFCSPHIGHO2_02_FULL_38_15]